MMTVQEKRIQAARTALILDQPFFGVLSLRLKVEEDSSVDTMATNGKRLAFNPKFVDTLSAPELLGVVAHEVLHCAAGHPWRRDSRDPKKWNVAADLAINPVLLDSGFTLPSGVLDDPSFHGKSAEFIYARLPEGEGDGGSGSGAGAGGDDSSSSSSFGEVEDATTGEEEGGESTGDDPTESDWKAATAQAANAAKMMGKLPGGVARFATEATIPRVDWKSVLRRFVSEVSSADYSWNRPSSRYLPRGLYLPSLRSEELGPIVVAVDTSGSIDQATLSTFGSELQSIADETSPRRVHVLYCDSAIRKEETFERGEEIKLAATGGGGTSFRPVFERIEAGDFPEPPSALIYLTDMCGRFPSSPPEIPTLWAATRRGTSAPFGEIVELLD